MKPVVLSLSLAALTAAASTELSTVRAQTMTPHAEMSFNNFSRVVSSSRHPKTGNRVPARTTYPPGYAAQPGVKAGTRGWTYTLPLRAQAGSQGSHFLTIRGMTQAIFVGPGNTTWPSQKHYQFKTGMAPSRPARAPSREHHPTAADVYSIASSPLPVTTWAIVEHAVSLTTPIVLKQPTEFLLWVEFKGGEWVDDTDGGQTIACEYQGGWGPNNVPYCGWTTGANPRTLVPFLGTGYHYRPKIGLLCDEPVLTVTGLHAQWYHPNPLATETFLGLSAVRATWTQVANPDMFFDVRAGNKYGSTGTAVVFLNVSNTWWPATTSLGAFGNLLLNPQDPALSVLTSIPFTLRAGGIYNGRGSPFMFTQFGRSQIGTIIKAQGVVFNQGFKDLKLTTAAAMRIS